MIKVCFLVSSLCNEGQVNVMYNIIQYMECARFDVSIITLIPEKANSRLDDFRRLPVSIHLLFPDRMPSPVAMFREVFYGLSYEQAFLSGLDTGELRRKLRFIYSLIKA